MSFKITTEKEIVTKEVQELEVSLHGFIGYKVKEIRESEDINISQLSRRLAKNGHSLSGTTISKIEQGLCPLKLNDLIEIGKVFNTKLDFFIPAEVIS